MNRNYVILELRYLFQGMEQVLYPAVLFGAADVVLVDCGYPSSLEMLEEQLRAHGIRPDDVTKLVLTHQDDDHMGAAAEWKDKYPAVQILASRAEEPYLSGKQKNLRLHQAEELQSRLPEEQKAWGEQFCGRYRALRPVSVDQVLSGGDVFDWGGGCEIVETPGHTPGHLSIRSLRGAFFITGDAAAAEDGHLAVANPEFCLDLPRAEESLETIRRWDGETYVCYHGGILRR